MKKINWLFMAICLAVMPVLQSCNDDDGYSIGDFTPPLWATVRVTGNAFYLDCDAWGKLWPVNTNMGWYEPIDGQRVITVFNPLSDKYGEYDHAVKLMSLYDVLTKEVEVLTPENDEEFGNDALLISKEDVGISGGYMNVIFIQNLPSKTKHRISLVRSQDEAALYADDGYIHLELRYNDYDDLTGYRQPGIVSYNLNSLDVTTGTKGIKLKLKHEKDGEVELTFDLKKTESSIEKMKDLDLPQMPLK